jgi:formate hydrogenlyase subunit 6/NADH:ubiquinone oxidoreductase subunit I
MRKIRIAAGVFFFTAYLLIFLHVFESVPAVSDGFPRLQFFPGILRFAAAFSVSGLLVVLSTAVITAFFGRWYCAAVCPFGVLQDFFIFIRRHLPFGKKFRYTKPLRLVHYSFAGLSIILFSAGIVTFLSWLEPYSVFGRLTVNLFRPAITPAVNFLSFQLYHHGITALNPLPAYDPGRAALLCSAAFFAFIAALSFFRGRLFCNLLCPAGAVLRLCAARAPFAFRIKHDACSRCGKCVSNCRAGCIDIVSGRIDSSRCVNCADCRDTCPQHAIYYGPRNSSVTKTVPDETNAQTRGEFIGSILKSSLVFAPILFPRSAAASVVSKFLPFKKNEPVMPPGAQTRALFNRRCTSCNLCVQACPDQIIRPSVAEYGASSFMQPRLDYDYGYCLFECTRCTEVCPTGALVCLSKAEKETTQIGKAKLIKGNCIVYSKNLPCTACTEHCPTKAADAVPYGKDLMAPEVDESVCVGCGACEHACPVNPKAIYVEGNEIQSSAKKKERVSPENRKGKGEMKKEKSNSDDFPF